MKTRKNLKKWRKTFQTTYMEGAENLEEILAGVDKDIQMWENGKIWTYDNIVEFGPHLPKKKVIETYNEQKIVRKKTWDTTL